jgi:hypothetical protein
MKFTNLVFQLKKLPVGTMVRVPHTQQVGWVQKHDLFLTCIGWITGGVSWVSGSSKVHKEVVPEGATLNGFI